MSNTDHIDEIEPTDTTQPTPSDTDQVVITMPARVKRALVAVVNFFRSLITGEIIINPTVSKGYDYLFYIAFLLLVSIITLFSSLHMQIRENVLSEQVRLLSERAVRTEEQRVKATTHSAIVDELKRRNIPLYDCLEPVTIIKNEKQKER